MAGKRQWVVHPNSLGTRAGRAGPQWALPGGAARARSAATTPDLPGADHVAGDVVSPGRLRRGGDVR